MSVVSNATHLQLFAMYDKRPRAIVNQSFSGFPDLLLGSKPGEPTKPVNFKGRSRSGQTLLPLSRACRVELPLLSGTRWKSMAACCSFRLLMQHE
jgi:hypothetical protein